MERRKGSYGKNDTIAAPATAPGGALTVIRISGPEAVEICSKLFRLASGIPLSERPAGTASFGRITAADGTVIDEAIATLFRAPRSYTGEDTVELSCHGSPYVTSEAMRLLCTLGARPAAAGEFTMRAFTAGRLDLSQAEAVADLIAASDRASHRMALDQMRGGYRQSLAEMRERLLNMTAMLELELDFSEEDVEFADRSSLKDLLEETLERVGSLAATFQLGNALKEGIPVAITGPPNAGKSTLLNCLLDEQRAMVSDIPGTTRDTVEGNLNIGGITYRLTDTAGLRESDDPLELMGIKRAREAVNAAAVVLMVEDINSFADASTAAAKTAACTVSRLAENGGRVILVLNKADTVCEDVARTVTAELGKTLPCPAIAISARLGHGKAELVRTLTCDRTADYLLAEGSIVSNVRHYEALKKISEALRQTLDAMHADLPADLLAHHLRDALYRAGGITGQSVITPEEVLADIFSKFCIGK